MQRSPIPRRVRGCCTVHASLSSWAARCGWSACASFPNIQLHSEPHTRGALTFSSPCRMRTPRSIFLINTLSQMNIMKRSALYRSWTCKVVSWEANYLGRKLNRCLRSHYSLQQFHRLGKGREEPRGFPNNCHFCHPLFPAIRHHSKHCNSSVFYFSLIHSLSTLWICRVKSQGIKVQFPWSVRYILSTCFRNSIKVNSRRQSYAKTPPDWTNVFQATIYHRWCTSR